MTLIPGKVVQRINQTKYKSFQIYSYFTIYSFTNFPLMVIDILLTKNCCKSIIKTDISAQLGVKKCTNMIKTY